MTTTDPDLAVALPAVNAAQAACAAFSQSTAQTSDYQALAALVFSAMTALRVVMLAKRGSTAQNDVSIYLYSAGLWSTFGALYQQINVTVGSPSTFSLNGMNIYAMAVRYTGDIANTDAIMAANGITDPFYPGPGPIIIPSSLLNLSSS